MALQLYAHSLSSYCQKALIALYENDTPFDYRTLEDPRANAELGALWPLKRFPVLVDDGRTLPEASIIIEHLALAHPGPVKLIPASAGDALEVRLMDRFFDNYISTPQQKIVFDSIRPAESHDAFGVNEARAMLDTACRWLDATMADGREWAVDETRPYRRYFPLGAPYRDLKGGPGAPALFTRSFLQPSIFQKPPCRTTPTSFCFVTQKNRIPAPSCPLQASSVRRRIPFILRTTCSTPATSSSITCSRLQILPTATALA